LWLNTIICGNDYDITAPENEKGGLVMNGTNAKKWSIRAGALVVLVAILSGGVHWFLCARGVCPIHPPIDDKPYSVVFVLGSTSNSRTINFDDNPELNARIDRVINTYGFAAYVVADGNPANQTSVFDFSEYKPGRVDLLLERETVSNRLTRFREHFSQALQDARAQTPEKDLLEAISLAARILSSRPEDEIREVVVISSGLSTAGILNYADQNEWLYSDATDIINILQSNRGLPDLENITVSWFQMFDVCGVVQDAIPGLQQENLRATWQLIVESGGGEFNPINAHPGRGIYEDLPPVTSVTIRPTFTLHVRPTQADVQRGTSHDFSALVVGQGITAQDVDWAIEGPAHPGTIIDSNGRLTLAPDDPRESIVIVAISTEDRSVTGQATVRLREEPIPPAIVKEITIFPDDLILGTMSPYNVFDINAMVLGENNPSQEVIFELFGNNDPNTRLEPNGRIFIGANETALLIIIRVTSVMNPAVYAEMPVRVFVPTPDTVEVRFFGDSAEPLNRAQAREAIAEWVDFINQQDSGIFLFGCTARLGTGARIAGRDTGGIGLGLARAETIRDMFVREFNIDPSRITVKGLGYDNPWHRDNGVSGTTSWNEAVAATNRRVVIMSADDDFAKRIYNGTWWQ
jgi:hypothetical protein